MSKGVWAILGYMMYIAEVTIELATNIRYL